MKKLSQVSLGFYGTPRMTSLLRSIGAKASPDIRKKAGHVISKSRVVSLTPGLWRLDRFLERNISQMLRAIKNSSSSWIWTVSEPTWFTKTKTGKSTLYPKGSKFLVSLDGKGKDKIQTIKPVK